MPRKTSKAGGEKQYTLRQRVEQFFMGAGGAATGLHGAQDAKIKRAEKYASGGPSMARGERMLSKRKK